MRTGAQVYALRKPVVLVLLALLLIGPGWPIGCTGSEENARSSPEVSAGRPREVTEKEAGKMSADTIVELIKKKEWEETTPPTELDSAIVPEVARLLDDADHEVRLLALMALGDTHTPEARRGILKALRDENINVRSTACRLILTNHDADGLTLLEQELAASTDEFVREHAALAIGKIGDPAADKALLEQAKREIDLDAQHGIHLALVRLKEPDSQKRYIDRLQQDDPKLLAGAIQDMEYIEDRMFLPYMVPLLDDERNALNVGPSAKKFYIRVCDVVVNVLNVVLQEPFSFNISRMKLYSPEERNEVKRVIQSMQ